MWSEKGNARLSAWRKFRQIQENQTIENQIQNTLDLWKLCHLGSTYYDFNEPNEWPTPWELIIQDNYDSFTKALGISWTLIMIKDWKNQNLFLRCYKDIEQSSYYFLVELDDLGLVLNYHFNQSISNKLIPQSSKLIREYNFIDLFNKTK